MRTVYDDITDMLEIIGEDSPYLERVKELQSDAAELEKLKDKVSPSAYYRNRTRIIRELIHMGVYYERIGVWSIK